MFNKIQMDTSDYQELIHYLSAKVLPPRLLASTKCARLNYKKGASLFQLGEDNHLYKIQTCHLCQMRSPLLPHPNRKLTPIPPPKPPWHHVGIDLVTDLPNNYEGYKHILVVVCYLSKFVAAQALISKTTKSVIEALSQIYLIYGVPSIIQHDQGK